MLARLALVALAFTTTPAFAQSKDADEASLPGTWEGTFNSEAVGTGGRGSVSRQAGPPHSGSRKPLGSTGGW